jgi:hypothetical protein
MERRKDFSWSSLTDPERIQYLSVWIDGRTTQESIAAFFSTKTEIIASFLNIHSEALAVHWLNAPQRMSNAPPSLHADDYPPFRWNRK